MTCSPPSSLERDLKEMWNAALDTCAGALCDAAEGMETDKILTMDAPSALRAMAIAIRNAKTPVS